MYKILFCILVFLGLFGLLQTQFANISPGRTNNNTNVDDNNDFGVKSYKTNYNITEPKIAGNTITVNSNSKIGKKREVDIDFVAHKKYIDYKNVFRGLSIQPKVTRHELMLTISEVMYKTFLQNEGLQNLFDVFSIDPEYACSSRNTLKFQKNVHKLMHFKPTQTAKPVFGKISQLLASKSYELIDKLCYVGYNYVDPETMINFFNKVANCIEIRLESFCHWKKITKNNRKHFISADVGCEWELSNVWKQDTYKQLLKELDYYIPQSADLTLETIPKPYDEFKSNDKRKTKVITRDQVQHVILRFK